MTRTLATFAAGVALTLGTVALVTPEPTSCPSEDSCTVDYREGGWHITEVQP